MSGQIRAKVTARVDYDRVRPPSPLKTYSRPPSPLKANAPSLSAPPISRPRAKVSSTATVRKAVSPPATAHTPVSQVGESVARAPSPLKSFFTGTRTTAPTPAVKAKVTGFTRSNASAVSSTPSLPEQRQRAITAPRETSPRRGEHNRRGSLSSHASTATASDARRTALSPTQSRNSSEDGGSVVSGIGGLRVKSKVSHLGEHSSLSVHSSPPSPSHAKAIRPIRVPSISKLSPSPPLRSLKSSPSGSLSPTSPAPRQQKFVTAVEPSSPKLHPLDIHRPGDDLIADSTRPPPLARVDPAQIPLPPQSPPSSTVSFSSRSSTSRSSVSCDSRTSDSSRSSVPTLNCRPNSLSRASGISHTRSRSNVEGLGIQLLLSSSEPSQDDAVEPDSHEKVEEDMHEDSPDRKLRDEAISNRKIADLEITNRSLLAINGTLEATKHRQAKEIRELRRRLRESILVLPPSAYRAAKTSLTADGTLKEDEENEDNEDDEDNEEDLEEEAVLEGKTDECYRRVRTLLDALLESGRRALETKPEDFVPRGSSGTKVLSEEEARPWRGEVGDPEMRVLAEDGDNTSFVLRSDNLSGSLTPSQGDDFTTSEDEVEASLTYSDSDSFPSPLPPITVTPSPSL